jgi:hypothetical protein
MGPSVDAEERLNTNTMLRLDCAPLNAIQIHVLATVL